MMKNTLLKLTLSIAILFYLIGAVIAQDNQAVRDTISMEPGRTHDVYYSLKSGEAASVVRSNWDIGFSTRVMDVAIRTNGANGVRLFTYPKADISAWNDLDTTGLSTWPEMYNDDTNWENGAFNINAAGGDLDYGWGVYNTITHHIAGDSLFVLQTPDGEFKKVWIVEKNPILNNYTFKYADLDGENEIEKVVELNQWSGKNFIGYSFETNDFVDREPMSDGWDLVFTKYITFYGGVAWYPITGILQNFNVQVASYPEVDTSFVDYTIQELDSFNISTIGNNWYELQGGMPPTYVVSDSLVYFLSDKESSIWKVVFEYYESNLGEIGFKKQLLQDNTSISEVASQQSGRLAISPNPVSGNTVQVLFDAEDNGNAQLTVFNLTGSKVYESSLSYQRGLNNHSLNVSAMPAGAYVVIVNNGDVRLQNKLIIH